MVKFYKRLKTDGFSFDHVSASTSASSVCHIRCFNLLDLLFASFYRDNYPYQVNVSFLYHVKMSENQRFIEMEQGLKIG